MLYACATKALLVGGLAIDLVFDDLTGDGLAVGVDSIDWERLTLAVSKAVIKTTVVQLNCESTVSVKTF